MQAPAAESAQVIVNKCISGYPVPIVSALGRYLTEVLTWTQQVPLVSRRDPIAACERLLLESVEMDRVAALSHHEAVVDVGSGAGFPGVVWALLHPQASVLLIERRARKIAFLERLIRVVPLNNVEVFGGEARSAAQMESRGRRYTLAVTMAVGNLASVAGEIQGLLAPGARLITTLPRVAVPEVPHRQLKLVSTVEGENGRYALYQFEL